MSNTNKYINKLKFCGEERALEPERGTRMRKYGGDAVQDKHVSVGRRSGSRGYTRALDI